MNIEFIPTNKESAMVVEKPKPAKLCIPQWYKDVVPASKDSRKINYEGGNDNLTIKECMPFIDSLSTGYIQETWCDINLEFTNDGTRVNYGYAHSPKILNVRDHVNVGHSEYFYPIEFVWITPWQFKLPKGYSALVVSPLNHFLPFHTLSGVIDSDEFFHTSGGNLPFYVYKGFKGIIPAGTPMYQIIPIKRESWLSSKRDFDYEDDFKRNYEVGKFFNGGYKKKFWHKKEYN